MFWIVKMLQCCDSVPEIPRTITALYHLNPFIPTVAFNICCPRDCVSRHNGGTAGAPLKPLRDDSALRALSSLRGLNGQQMLNATVGKNGLSVQS